MMSKSTGPRLNQTSTKLPRNFVINCELFKVVVLVFNKSISHLMMKSLTYFYSMKAIFWQLSNYADITVLNFTQSRTVLKYPYLQLGLRCSNVKNYPHSCTDLNSSYGMMLLYSWKHYKHEAFRKFKNKFFSDEEHIFSHYNQLQRFTVQLRPLFPKLFQTEHPEGEVSCNDMEMSSHKKCFFKRNENTCDFTMKRGC